jgi:hypothetical protein
MTERKPTLDYGRPQEPVPFDYLLATGCAGAIIGAVVLGLGFLVLTPLLPPAQYDTEEGMRILSALAAGGIIGLILGVVLGVRRWRRSS